METLEHIPVVIGPLIEQTRLSAGLDYYKPTMSQLEYEQLATAEVTFTFKNRGKQRLTDYVSPDQLQERLDQLRQNGWAQDEINYLRGLKTTDSEPVFTNDFLGYISESGLPEVEIRIDEETSDLAVETTGPAPLVTFWETVVMSEVNELYFEEYVKACGLDILEVYDEGDQRLSEKIALLQSRPDIKFADFGTRRHFSLRWQRHVIERLANECPDNLIGTSNLAFAESLGIKPIGTFAHELPMIYAGIAEATEADVRTSHSQMLRDWIDRYPDLGIALTDTFGSEFFFSDFTPEQADKFRGLRHDSGDPIEFGEQVIRFYQGLGIDPTTKTIVFSDGLDIDTIVHLQDHFKGRINTVYGWGTTLTNDLGLPALNIVMKATRVRLPKTSQEAELVKLSDNEGKHTGPEQKVKEYRYGHFVARALQNKS